MAFPILQQIKSSIENTEQSSLLSFKNGGKFKLIGVVILHDFGDNKAQREDELISQYSASWEPTVAYLQTYLLTLLEQLALVTESTQQARRILLHQARHELMELERRLPKLLGQLYYIFEGRGRETLHRIIQIQNNSSDGSISITKAMWEGLRSLQAAIIAADTSKLYLETEGFAGRIGRMAGALKSVRSFKRLQIDPGEAAQQLNLVDCLQAELANFNYANTHTGKHARLEGFKPNSQYNIVVIKSAWARLLINLFSNISKYSNDNTAWVIELHDKILTLKNIGDYDPDVTSTMLMKFGARGKKAKAEYIDGDGIGLTDARLAANLLGIEFSYRIIPFSDQRRAWHSYELNLKNVLTIQHNT